MIRPASLLALFIAAASPSAAVCQSVLPPAIGDGFEAQVAWTSRGILELKAPAPRRPSLLSEDSFSPNLLDRAAEPLPNFHPVSPGLFRSGQPSAEGLRRVAASGVGMILSLRNSMSDEERDEAKRLGLTIAHIPMNGILSPSFREVDRALAVLANPSRPGLLVHCRHGKDRTGVVVGAYRVVVEGVDIKNAAAEARAIGCCHAGFKNLEGYLRDYQRRHAARRPKAAASRRPD